MCDDEALAVNPWSRPRIYQEPRGTVSQCHSARSITLHYSILLDYTALHCTALQNTVSHCTALHCTALQNTVPHCTALHCTALQRTAVHISAV